LRQRYWAARESLREKSGWLKALLTFDRATLEDAYVASRMSRAQEKGEREGAAYLQSQPARPQPLDDAALRRFMARMDQLDARILLRRARD
jgi:hypothetical protein